jgi:hypothetical protein
MKPDTNNCPHCGAEMSEWYGLGGLIWECESSHPVSMPFTQSELCLTREGKRKAEAENQRLTNALVSILHITNCYDGNFAKALDNVDLIVTNALQKK